MSVGAKKNKIELSTEVTNLVVSDAQRRLDLQMVLADIWGTKAHVLMLFDQEIISAENAQKIIEALVDIEDAYARGDFEIDPGLGAQLTLEKEIIVRAGEEAGLSTHTARSRNDQVMVTELIFLREEVFSIIKEYDAVSRSLLELSKKHIDTVMPGYTHMQPGKPTSFSHWCLLYCASFIRVFEGIFEKFKRYDASPLGAVESFGTSWKIDREKTRDLLGFAAVWELPLDAISHRGYLQYELLQTLALFGVELTRFAGDLLLYTTHEYGFIELGDQVAQRLHPITGSSVMAQKRNPDALELLRAIGGKLQSLPLRASSLLSNLPAGYNRDSRELKGCISESFNLAKESLQVMNTVLSTLTVDEERMKEVVISNYSLTTDVADFIAQKSALPYRKVYKIVGIAVDELMKQKLPLHHLSLDRLEEIALNDFQIELKLERSEFSFIQDPIAALKRREHIGGTSTAAINGVISNLNLRHSSLFKSFSERKARISRAKEKTEKRVMQLLN